MNFLRVEDKSREVIVNFNYVQSIYCYNFDNKMAAAYKIFIDQCKGSIVLYFESKEERDEVYGKIITYLQSVQYNDLESFRSIYKIREKRKYG